MGMDSNGMVGDDLRHDVTSGPMVDEDDDGALDRRERFGPDVVGGMDTREKSKGINKDFLNYIPNSRNIMEQLDVIDDGGAGQNTLKLRDDDDDGQEAGGGVEPVLGNEKDDVRFGGGDNKVAMLKWRTILSGNQTESRSILKLKNTKKKKRGAKSFAGGGMGRKRKTVSSQFGSIEAFLSRGKGNSPGSS